MAYNIAMNMWCEARRSERRGKGLNVIVTLFQEKEPALAN